jgi:hypothetical protein
MRPVQSVNHAPGLYKSISQPSRAGLMFGYRPYGPRSDSRSIFEFPHGLCRAGLTYERELLEALKGGSFHAASKARCGEVARSSEEKAFSAGFENPLPAVQVRGWPSFHELAQNQL